MVLPHAAARSTPALLFSRSASRSLFLPLVPRASYPFSPSQGSRALHSSSSRQTSLLLGDRRSSAGESTLSRIGVTPRPLQTYNRGSIRLLTTKREKVKVLLVLYDGGKHAEQVRNPYSRTRCCLFCVWLAPIILCHSMSWSLALAQGSVPGLDMSAAFPASVLLLPCRQADEGWVVGGDALVWIAMRGSSRWSTTLLGKLQSWASWAGTALWGQGFGVLSGWWGLVLALPAVLATLPPCLPRSLQRPASTTVSALCLAWDENHL